MDPTVETISSLTPRRSYTIHYLKSFAQSCRSSPPDVDLREINSELLANGSSDCRSRGDAVLTPGSGTKHGRRRRKSRNRKRSQGLDTSCVSTPSLNTFKQSLPPLKLNSHATNFHASPNNKNNSTGIEDVKFSSSDEFYSPQSDRTSSSPEQKIDLGALFVRERHRAPPMPAARTLEDIEREMIPGNRTGSFLTCEAVEQSILADGNSTATDEYYSSPTANSSTSKEGWRQGGEDKAASKHLLSVLQKKASGEEGGSNSEKELLGELISSSPISDDFSNLNGILKRYERIAAADFERAVLESKKQAGGGEGADSSTTFGCSLTVDSLRTSVKEQSPRGGERLGATNTTDGRTGSSGKVTKRTPRKYVQTAAKSWQVQPSWNMLSPTGYMAVSPPAVPPPPTPPPPNVFVQTRPTVETPLVPQALHALQKLVDHQLHILNSIPGEVTPGMLHERLSRSVLGYPPTGTHLLLATSAYPVISPRFV